MSVHRVIGRLETVAEDHARPADLASIRSHWGAQKHPCLEFHYPCTWIRMVDCEEICFSLEKLESNSCEEPAAWTVLQSLKKVLEISQGEGATGDSIDGDLMD